MDPQLYLLKHSEELSRKYPGRYVAIVDDKLISADINAAVAFRKAKEKFPNKEIAIFYMATDEEMVTLLIL